MDRCLKDKAHFIIAQTIWNNKNGKAVFAEQVFDRCQRKFQDEINRELYNLIEEGGGGGTGKDGKTPVLKAGEITSLPYGAEPTFKLVYEGNNHEGNPVYRMNLGLPQGKPGEDGNDGNDGDDGISPTLRLTEQGIEVSYDKGGTWSLLVPISEFHVTNEYVNTPDEEDITVVDDKLKFNDKEYNISEFSGLGRVYLRKNIVNGKNVLAYNAFNSSSTIYHIQYDYDLDGRTVVIPNNCVLLFEGGSLSNGTIVFNQTHINNGKFINIIPSGIINNRIVYAKWFITEDYTKVIQWLFTIAAVGIQIELENKIYNIDTTNPNGYANGFIKIDDCNSFIVNGNGATIYDIIEYDTISDKLYEFIRFTNCSNVNINNITYKWKYEAEIVDKVKGIIFIRTLGECKNFNLNFEVINVGRGLYSGSFSNTNIGRGFCDSIVKVKATKVGYPIAIEIGDNNDFFSIYENVHRGNYYCGLSNSKVHVKGKNPVGTSCHVLLSDGATTTDYLHCKNVDIIVEDTGSTNNTIFAVLVQTYSTSVAPHLVGRTESYNISFNAKIFVPEHTTSIIEPIVWVGFGENRENVNFNADITILSNNENNRFIRIDTTNSYRIIATITGYIKYVTNSFLGILKEDERLDFYNVRGEECRIWFGSSEEKQGIVRFIDCNNAMFASANSAYNNYPTVYKYNSKVRYGTNELINIVNEESPVVIDGLTINTTANKVLIKSSTDNTYITFSGIILGNFQVIDVILIPTIDTTLEFASTIKLMGGVRRGMRLKADKYYNFKLIRIEGIYCIFGPIYDTDIANIGSTNNRPTLTNKDVGFYYWDITIGKPVWWNGTAWVTYSESGGGGGADGKTPVMQIGNVTTVDAGGVATANVRQDGTDVSGNPIYKIDFGIPRGSDGSNGTNGDDGIDGKTPVFETGTISTLEPDQPATCTITKIGDDPQGNPIYRVDVGIPKGNTGEPGATPSLDGYATEAWVTTQITNTVGIINASLDNINGEIV